MRMKHLFSILCITWLVAAFLGCNSSAGSQSVSIPKTQPSASTTPDEEYPQQLNDIFVDDDRLSYNGYDVLRLKKKVKYEYPNEKGETKSDLIEVSYAVLKRGNQTLAKFEGVYFGLGNATDFGLFSLLGGDYKQLIVSQTVPRGGRHWVVSLSPDFHVLFDSGDYGVGREEFSVIDIDKDGRYEISLPVTAFYSMQDVMYIGEIPLPEIVFKYDEGAKKYFPANPIFQEYALRGIEDDSRKLSPDEKNNYLSKRLKIFLRYIYAGKKDEAWSFFDREYKLPNKEEMRSKIKAVLEDEGVYKYLYRKRAT
jgi:hypothetical protein